MALASICTRITLTFSDPYFGTVTMKMDDTGLGGLGFAYHFNDFFSIRATSCSRGNGAYIGSGWNGCGSDRTAFLQTGRFNLDYNMINRRLTPVLTAGIGYQYLEIDNSQTYFIQGLARRILRTTATTTKPTLPGMSAPGSAGMSPTSYSSK